MKERKRFKDASTQKHLCHDRESCQSPSHPFAIRSQVFHRVLKGKGVFHIIELIHEIETFVLLKIPIGLLRGDLMRHRELCYQRHDVIDLVYD